MTQKILIILILLLLISVLFFILSAEKTDKNQRQFSQIQDREFVEIKIGEQLLNVEVVNSAQSTSQGLSGRDQIGAGGMLFIFPDSQKRYFWMKDMRFNIDIIWILEGVVTQITPDVPKPEENTPDYKLESYSSDQDASMVLELPAGDAQKFNIKPGDLVQLAQ